MTTVAATWFLSIDHANQLEPVEWPDLERQVSADQSFVVATERGLFTIREVSMGASDRRAVP